LTDLPNEAIAEIGKAAGSSAKQVRQVCKATSAGFDGSSDLGPGGRR
jgi:hypothetical protein